jgi:LmbE family N-acetylglucosaminyl deacetylase
MSAHPRPTLTDVSALGVVLGIWAHPDDETLLSGGLMAAAREAGQRVVCVTATLGEQGTSDPLRWPPDRLRRVRRQELRASLAALGVDEHISLELPDGGCALQPAEPIVDRLAGIIDTVRPDTIITFGPDGMTGHEDHQTVSRWTTEARERSRTTAQLLYATTTEEFAVQWAEVAGDFPVFLADGLPLATPASQLAFRMPLSAHLLDQKMVALRAQATQMTPLLDALGEDLVRHYWSIETFVAADAHRTETAQWGTWRMAA